MNPEPPVCFYCGACVSGKGKGDHFPLPRNCGGTLTVPCCESCHDMKDRYAVGQWPTEWVEAVLRDMPRMSRETRLFLAKMVRVTAEAMGRSNPRVDGAADEQTKKEQGT